MALTHCEWCEHEVPDSAFCYRCGHQLGDPPESRGLSGTSKVVAKPSMIQRGISGVMGIPQGRPESLSGVRRAFAAAPDESVLRPSIVSTIFPQLPKPDMVAFRASLALGSATVLLLGVLKLYPIALIAAAIMVPALAILYFYDVNVYEDNPASVVALTLLCGAVGGVIAALIAKALLPTGAAVFTESDSDKVVLRGVVLPLISVALILVGPLILLRQKHFDDVLDGATFGAGAAVAFTGAEVIIQALDAFDGGLRPGGDILPWLARLMSIAVALPLLTMTVMGAATGALWLRYRAPIRDRSALGRLGKPAIAIPAAAVLLIAGALAQAALPVGVALVILAALAVVGILWLRRAVHVGLIEEALEIESAATAPCGNCGRNTRLGSFCEHCGIALSALPRSRSGSHAMPVPPPEATNA